MPENPLFPRKVDIEGRSRRRLGCILTIVGLTGMLLATIALFAYFAFREVPLRISPETTYITGPLKSDASQVDYLAAWEQVASPEAIATDDNGGRSIVQHLDAFSASPPGRFAEICRKLGLDAATIKPDMTFEEPYSFLLIYVEGEDFDPAVTGNLDGNADEATAVIDGGPNASRSDISWALHERLYRPWTLTDLPMMEQWLRQSGPAMDLVSEAVRKPVFHIPNARDTEDALLLEASYSETHLVRSFARGLEVRANYRIGTGNIDGAIDDIVACARLGRQTRRNGTLIRMLVGIAVEGIANSIRIAGSLEHPPTKEELERLRAELDDLPPLASIEKAMLFERYRSLDLIQALAHGKTTLTDLDLPDQIPGRGIDWNVVARRMNAHWDTAASSGWADPSDPHPMAYISTQIRSEWLGDTLVGFTAASKDATFEASWRNRCIERMQRISLAMLLYESDHGALPPAYTIDAKGTPLHSWRVLLLPYLGQQALFDKIRLNEPWDSDHNRKFHDHPVAFYQCPSAVGAQGQTTYCVVVGPEMPFDGPKEKKLADFGPKSASMILVVETTSPVCWMDPTQDMPQELAELGVKEKDRSGGEIDSRHPGGVIIGCRSGSSQFLSQTTDDESLEGLLRGTDDEMP